MLPKLKIKRCDETKRSDGVVLLTVGRNTRAINKTSEFEAIIAIDRGGNIVWQRELDFVLMDCRQSQVGTFLIMGTDGRIVEMGFDGTILHQWYNPDRFPNGCDGIPVHTPKFHHAVCEISTGLLATLSIEQLPLAQPQGDWTHFMGDTVVLFERSGRIVHEISLACLLDMERYSHDAAIPYWPAQGWAGTLDWTHGNCLIEDPIDGGLLLSLRHQDAVVKLSAEGELVWILGDPTGWRDPWREKLLKIEGKRPFYHQHDLSFTSNGDLMLFDNGTAGSFPPNPRQPLAERQSFALSYRIDTNTMTATETWRYGKLPYSHYVSGVCEMPNGNRFIACTGLKHDLDGNRVEVVPKGIGSIELVEVTPAGERVFHAVMEDKTAVPDVGWNGFRPEYLNSQTAKLLVSEA
ncbi:MAG: aryl-sulfate sulfotransferase [Chloroflexota bacterium]